MSWSIVDNGLWFSNLKFEYGFYFPPSAITEVFEIIGIFSNCVEYNGFLTEA